MNNIVVAFIAMLGGGGGLALFNYLSSRSKDNADYKMAEFKDGTEVRKEYLDQIKTLREDNKALDIEVEKQRSYGEAWRDKYYTLLTKQNTILEQNSDIKQKAKDNEEINK